MVHARSADASSTSRPGRDRLARQTVEVAVLVAQERPARTSAARPAPPRISQPVVSCCSHQSASRRDSRLGQTAQAHQSISASAAWPRKKAAAGEFASISGYEDSAPWICNAARPREMPRWASPRRESASGHQAFLSARPPAIAAARRSAPAGLGRANSPAGAAARAGAGDRCPPPAIPRDHRLGSRLGGRVLACRPPGGQITGGQIRLPPA